MNESSGSRRLRSCQGIIGHGTDGANLVLAGTECADHGAFAGAEAGAGGVVLDSQNFQQCPNASERLVT